MERQESLDQKLHEHEVKSNKDFESKLKLFMTALIFAILSFAIQYPIKSSSGICLKLMEIFSWVILLLSGYFSLVVCSKFPIGVISKLADKINVFWSKNWTDEILMWRLFYFSLFLLLLVKAIERF
ncbi:hypothetical protein OQJ02_05060 [Legionella sp. PATHC032]|uniref:hypothetical protein n=1 Tax=Legionella sp. PATHC032 TaxID=2992039 RepID=UPI001B2F7691|nr:hypothetical protein [Legionella sp. PATHC032]MCW8420999.1 hypothetical protein [Legionella sp. PATHC032]HAZ7573794.1 hypothetical protein [Legionella pneumophila]HBA1634300.1 hypothetical protein [Legionella pneumophila]